MTFGEKVKADRYERRMSQEQYAAFVGVTRVTISRVETDKAGAYAKLAVSWKTGVKEDEPAK